MGGLQHEGFHFSDVLPCRRELCHMLHLHRKAEIQILCQTPIATQDGIHQWVEEADDGASSDDDAATASTSRICPIVTHLEAKMIDEMAK